MIYMQKFLTTQSEQSRKSRPDGIWKPYTLRRMVLTLLGVNRSSRLQDRHKLGRASPTCNVRTSRGFFASRGRILPSTTRTSGVRYRLQATKKYDEAVRTTSM